MPLTIKLRQGTKSQLSTLNTGLTLGEPLYVTDTLEVYVASGTTTKRSLAIDIANFDDLTSMATDDLLYMYDVSETGVKARKITFSAFKTALNIPAASSDEKVAITSGQTAGYLGTNGSDGVLQTASGIIMSSTASVSTIRFGFASEAQGDIAFRNASTWTRLAPGAPDALLQSGGPGANPSYTVIINGGTFS